MKSMLPCAPPAIRLAQILLAIGLFAAGCSGESDRVTDRASVDRIEIVTMESFPVQITVIAEGFLPDSCTEIGAITRDRNGKAFTVTIGTVRDPNLICAQATVPFRVPVPLDVRGLPAGTYTVDVNGVIVSFTLDTDNTPPAG